MLFAFISFRSHLRRCFRTKFTFVVRSTGNRSGIRRRRTEKLEYGTYARTARTPPAARALARRSPSKTFRLVRRYRFAFPGTRSLYILNPFVQRYVTILHSYRLYTLHASKSLTIDVAVCLPFVRSFVYESTVIYFLYKLRYSKPDIEQF